MSLLCKSSIHALIRHTFTERLLYTSAVQGAGDSQVSETKSLSSRHVWATKTVGLLTCLQVITIQSDTCYTEKCGGHSGGSMEGSVKLGETAHGRKHGSVYFCLFDAFEFFKFP